METSQPKTSFQTLLRKPPSALHTFQKEIEEKMGKSIYPSPDKKRIKIKSQRPRRTAPQSVQRIALNAEPSPQSVERIVSTAESTEETNESLVNNCDKRIQVHGTAEWPHSVHGALTCNINNAKTCGTGIMIGPNIVLTAGHNLYSFQLKAFANLQSIQFLPGINGQVLPFGPVEVEQYFVSPNYIQEGKEDYGILILKEPIGEMTGYFGLACLEPEEIEQKRINITGYPGDKVATKPNCYEMWGMEGTVAYIDQIRGHINYLIDTTTGQSGSGVWYREGEDYYVCGVHVHGDRSVNRATLLTRNLYQQIHEWLQRANFKELKDLRLLCREVNVECVSLLLKYNFENLRVLVLTVSAIGDQEATTLAQNTSWVNLSDLSLSLNNIGAEGAKALSQNTSWINLSLLDLTNNNISDEGAKELAKNTSWTNLSTLYLTRNNIGNEGAKELSRNISWINLSRLDLTDNKIDAEGVKELAKNTSWINLSTLCRSFSNIGNEGAEGLAKNTSWVNLSILELNVNNIGAEGAKALSQNTSWINLSRLDLTDNKIGPEGAKELARNTSWINLSTLNLSFNNIGNEGAEGLAKNTSWINLSTLNLSFNNIDNEGAKGLAKNASWVNLSKLNLYKYWRTDEHVIESLRQNKTWKNIEIV